MNKENYVSLEVAQLLSKKKINIPTIYYRISKDTDNCEIGDLLSSAEVYRHRFNKLYAFPAPSLYKVQKWLREKYNCYVQVTHEAYRTGVNNLVQVLFYEPNDDDCWSNKSSGVYGDNAEFKTYEEALNFGILEALKRIDNSKISDK